MNNLTINKGCDKTFDSFIATVETPINSRIKYEYDEVSSVLKVDRFFSSALTLPYSYGFINCTMGKDGDALDVIILCSEFIYPLSTIECRPIGLLNLIDEAGQDDKVLALPIRESYPEHWDAIQDINDVPKSMLKIIEHYFAHYKDLSKHKDAVTVGNFLNKIAACELLRECWIDK